MQYKKFGKLDTETSRFGMGCMRLPVLKSEDGKTIINESEAIRMIHYAIDNGVSYIDTAYPYHNGQSELIVGKALKNGYREKVKLATKCPVWLVNSQQDFDKILDEQLKKLGVDYIDFYLLHALSTDRWEKIKDINLLESLDKAKKQGKIKHAGFSFHDKLDTFKTILDSYDWDMCQIQLNILDANIQAGVEGLKYAGLRGIPVVIMEPLKGGKLGLNIPEDAKKIWDSAEIKRPPVEWAFRWLYNFPEVAVILSGVSTMDQLKENIRIFSSAEDKCMSQTELNIVARVKEYYESRIKVGCTACRYCIPCPKGVSIPEIFKLYNDAAMYNTVHEYSIHYKKLVEEGKDVSKCVRCGKCVKACPQSIAIPEKLREAESLLTK